MEKDLQFSRQHIAISSNLESLCCEIYYYLTKCSLNQMLFDEQESGRQDHFHVGMGLTTLLTHQIQKPIDDEWSSPIVMPKQYASRVRYNTPLFISHSLTWTK